MMNKEGIITGRLESYKFLSYIFLALPDDKFTQKVLALKGLTKDASEDEGLALIHKYILEKENVPLDEVLVDLSVDRTQLLRGLTMDGPRPPYESIYLSKAPEDVMGELNAMYNSIQYGISTEVHESHEQIGVELNFMQILCDNEQGAMLQQDEAELQNLKNVQLAFMSNHLGQWASLYADEMINHARTDFYKGIAIVLRNFIQEELAYLQV